MFGVLKNLSRLHDIPGLGKLTKLRLREYSREDIKGFRETQDLALRGAKEIHAILEPGMTEKKVASLLRTWLKDNGVKNYLHGPFAWFGDRTRFDNCPAYSYFFPSDRTLTENDVVILDLAPVYNGYPADIGYALSMRENPEFEKAILKLKEYREWIPHLFMSGKTGAEIYDEVEKKLKADGYDNCHALYPLGVLGHRMHPMIDGPVPGMLKPFSWQFYWSVLSRGAFTETLGDFHSGDLDGLWAIEPHLGAKGFGVKFEEMLWVRDGKAEWIGEGVFYDSNP